MGEPPSPITAPEPDGRRSGVRYQVLGMLCLLSFVLYLDRICINQAVGDIEKDLGISHTMMGFVFGAFTLAYGLFEVPVGHWGDRHGSRGVLTRIVLWWSLFTMLTGAATGLIMLLIIRFLFGAGEAGAFPNTARVLARWFPQADRGAAQGLVVTAALVGGAAAPVLAQILIKTVGWRWAFASLGVPGLLWAGVFWWWFRDNPAEHSGVNPQELRYLTSNGEVPSRFELHPALPWGHILTSTNIWMLGTVTTCGSFTTYLFFFWYPTYLQQGRGVAPETSSWLASMVLAGGALGSLLGGYLSDALVRLMGDRRWSRRVIGCCALSGAAGLMVASIHCDAPWLAALCATLACFGVHLQLASWWGVVAEISGKHVGAVFGLVNSMGVPGAIGSPIFMGALADWLRQKGYSGRAQWDPAFYSYGGVLLFGAACWLLIDATRPIVPPKPSGEDSFPEVEDQLRPAHQEVRVKPSQQEFTEPRPPE